MNVRPWWADALQWILWALAMAGIAWSLSRGRDRPRAPALANQLYYPASATILFGLGTLIVVALFVLAFREYGMGTAWPVYVLIGMLALVCCHYFVDCLCARYWLTDEGLNYWSIFTGRRLFKWNELRSVRFAWLMKWFILQDANGQKARLSAMLAGLPEFAKALIYHNPSAIEGRSETVIRKTAQGKPPNIWE